MIEISCKQRLLLACYILDQQHAALFGTSPLISLPRSALDLPFPTPQTQWDSPFPIDHPAPKCDTLCDAITATSQSRSPKKDYYDAFRSLLLISALSDPHNNLDAQTTPLLHTIEPSPRVELAFHVMMLCKNTPIQDLLAIILDSKQSSPSEQTAAQIEIRDWAKRETGGGGGGENCIHAALEHAFAILKIYRAESKTGLLFQEWAVFLAVVVLWARVRVSGGEDAGGSERDVEAIIRDGAVEGMGQKEMRKILLWVKARFEVFASQQRQGLVVKALNGIQRLVGSGSEKGWF